MAAGHLVADLQLALDGDVDLHHLDDARGKLVALAELVDLLLEEHLDGVDLVVDLLEDLVGLALVLVDLDVLPVLVRNLVEVGVGELLALREELLALVADELGRGGRADQEVLANAVMRRVENDLDLVVHVLFELGALGLFDLK